MEQAREAEIQQEAIKRKKATSDYWAAELESIYRANEGKEDVSVVQDTTEMHHNPKEIIGTTQA